MLYRAENAAAVEQAIRECPEQSVEFARLLDASFYCGEDDLRTVADGLDTVRVSIEVACNGRSGPIPVQLMPEERVPGQLCRIHRRFVQLRSRLHDAVDADLHMSHKTVLTFCPRRSRRT